MKKLFAVIGDPIAHSMSPQMHNDLFQYYGIDAHYHALHVKTEDLADAVKGLKAVGIAGFNVTVPHKSAIIAFLDEVDPLAMAIGAVNTVLNENGRLIGYNTDGKGFLRGLTDEMPSIVDKRTLIVGAGGAARGIYFSMASSGVKRIDIANRTVEKGVTLINECPYSVESFAIDMKKAEDELGHYDLIIQTTSIGMEPNTECQPLSLHNISLHTFVSDIIYNPLETQLLREAKNKGAVIQNGLKMFIFQGALAFEKWTGIFPDTSRMEKLVKTRLGGTKC